MERVLNNQALKDRTVLVSSSNASADLAIELERFGVRTIKLPRLEIHEPESYVALDEAVENLFGYDWIVFTNVHAVDYFLRRFDQLNHDISDLDDLRVCAIGDATKTRLEESQVHVDLTPDDHAASTVIDTIELFLGGRESLRGLNFLIPRATIARDALSNMLEHAGTRVDIVAAYRTTANQKALARIRALLSGGGIDCIAFTSASEIRNFADLFDALDFTRYLRGVALACIDDVTAQIAAEFGLQSAITSERFIIPALANAMVEFFEKQ